MNPLPVINLSASSGTICTGQQVSISASGAGTYTWQPLNVSAVTVTDSPVSTQMYVCNGTNGNGCVGSSSLTVVVFTCAGVTTNASMQQALSVFPNPANDKIIVKFETERAIQGRLKLFDVNGKLVMEQTVSFSKQKAGQELDICTLANGIYTLEFYSGNNSAKLKVVKE